VRLLIDSGFEIGVRGRRSPDNRVGPEASARRTLYGFFFTFPTNYFTWLIRRHGCTCARIRRLSVDKASRKTEER